MNFPSNLLTRQILNNPEKAKELLGLQSVDADTLNGVPAYRYVMDVGNSWLRGWFMGDRHGLISINLTHFIVPPKHPYEGLWYPNEELNVSIVAAATMPELLRGIAGGNLPDRAPKPAITRLLYNAAPALTLPITQTIAERKIAKALCWRDDGKDFPQLMKRMGAKKSKRRGQRVYYWK